MTFDINEHVADLIELFDGSIYWKDVDGVYLGCNHYAASKAGLNGPKEIIGKTDYDLFEKAEADVYRKNDLIVIREAKELAVEEIVPSSEAKNRAHLSFKRPLYSKNEPRTIIGLIGYTIDITAKKDAKRLKLENERQQTALLEEQEKIIALAHKVAHDITSPLTALNMAVQMCNELPENKRSLLKRTAESILDIANNLLNSFRKNQQSATPAIEARQPLLVSDLLIQLLSEKKAQYRDKSLTFNTVISDSAHFAFIECQATEFRRSMSNLINNAADALKSKADGVVTVRLTIDTDNVVAEVTDNGCGMPSMMMERMRNRQSFTSGKENGHGLGLQQVWDMLEHNGGSMDVQSTPGQGTSIKLSFSRVAAASWIAQDIRLSPDGIIVVLDDEESIHTAWDLRLASFLTTYPKLRIHHFKQGQEALDFLATLNQEEKSHTVFLSDYELLHQSRSGLQIVEASQIKHSMLVTSYYFNPQIRAEADRLVIKVLPKQMASVVPIHVG